MKWFTSCTEMVVEMKAFCFFYIYIHVTELQLWSVKSIKTVKTQFPLYWSI